MFFLRKKLARSVLLVFAVVFVVGCSPAASQERSSGAEDDLVIDSGDCITTGDAAGTGQTWLTVFFPDRRAWYAVPEFRRVKLDDDGVSSLSLAEEALALLLEGPGDAALLPVFPEGSEVEGLTLNGSLLTVDFTEEFAEGFPGGSSWELLVLRSLVNTLVEIPGVDRVQLLFGGEKRETLGGHIAVNVPLERQPVDLETIQLDYDRYELAQKRVDEGEEQWRLYPLSTACREARLLGFSGGEDFRLLELDLGELEKRSPHAVVQVDTAADSYIMLLVQPVKAGSSGLWAIVDIRPLAKAGKLH
jgi:hypothetical protein